jgi:hypothetical protein
MLLPWGDGPEPVQTGLTQSTGWASPPPPRVGCPWEARSALTLTPWEQFFYWELESSFSLHPTPHSCLPLNPQLLWVCAPPFRMSWAHRFPVTQVPNGVNICHLLQNSPLDYPQMCS